MNKTKIEWTDYTWNPVVGCKHGCYYCYAKRMNDRFKWIPKWSEPKFFVGRLWGLRLPKKPSKIFVGSMCDLFGDWIPKKWIRAVIDVAKYNPQHTFQFLTKNPKRYLEFDFPSNCWLGTTITSYDLENRDRLLTFRNVKSTSSTYEYYKFVSVEPLLADVSKHNFNGIDLVIVGAMTGRGAIKPKKEWIDSIKHPNIFYKDNIKKYLTKRIK